MKWGYLNSSKPCLLSSANMQKSFWLFTIKVVKANILPVEAFTDIPLLCSCMVTAFMPTGRESCRIELAERVQTYFIKNIVCFIITQSVFVLIQKKKRHVEIHEITNLHPLIVQLTCCNFQSRNSALCFMNSTVEGIYEAFALFLLPSLCDGSKNNAKAS